jgi:hypothetical protein
MTDPTVEAVARAIVAAGYAGIPDRAEAYAQAALSVARPLIEREARAKALEDAADSLKISFTSSVALHVGHHLRARATRERGEG